MHAVGDLAPSVRLRPVRADDEDFLFELYASTRAAELERTGWDETAKLGFLRMQFAAQRAYYASQFAAAQFDVIEADSTPVGRLYVLRDQAEIRIIDVTLLPSWCHRGIGTRLIGAILEEARASTRSVALSVDRWNAGAHRLYVRLGFREESSDEVYVRMRYDAALTGDEGR
jgi:RimJ/RimL family protein N-acetyltransferase